ncbi:MAG: chemotaxis protein CheX [Candidatus Omnitrophota bacterium]
MSAVIMNLGECAKTGILLALKAMFKIEPSEPPVLEMKVVTRVEICSGPESYASLVTLSHEETKASGFVILYLPKATGKKLLENLGIKKPTAEDVKDIAGEFCSIVAGVFKAEVTKLGLGNMNVSLPKTYSEGVDQEIPGVHVDTKYAVSIFHNDSQLMTVEVAFASEGH